MTEKKDEEVPFEEITKWAAKDDYQLKQKAAQAVSDVCVQSDVKLKIFLLAAARKKIEVIGRLFKTSDYLFEQTFSEQNIQNMTIPQKLQAYQIIQNNLSDYLGSLAGSEEALQEVTKILQNINVNNFTVNVGQENEAVTKLQKILDKLPVHSRERLRKVLLLLPSKVDNGQPTDTTTGGDSSSGADGSGKAVAPTPTDSAASVPAVGGQVSPPPRL